MATTQLFKNTANNVHRKRYMTNENDFSKGMQFTNTPLDSGYVKSIVNFDLKNDGTSLTPRGGLQEIDPEQVPCAISYDDSKSDYFIHHAGSMYVYSYDETKSYLCNYFLICATDSYNQCETDPDSTYLVLELPTELGHSETVFAASKGYNSSKPRYKLYFKPSVDSIHSLNRVSRVPRDGIYTSLEGVTYLPVLGISSGNLGRALGKIYAKFGQDTFDDFDWWIEPVTPYEVQPTQAMNYGYNMLKENPYTFTNTVSATGAIQLTGVLPYDESGNLLLTARAGTPMVFKLFYKYPQTDLTNSDKYLVQWEVQDLNSNSNAEVIKKVRGSTEYTPGTDITFAYTPTQTAFSIIVRLYKKSEIIAQDAAWEADQILQKLVTKDDNLTPNQVTTLASYYLTGTSDTSMLNIKPVKYVIPSATGMCTWQQRLVFWGVENAKNTLFISEINNPAYIPYPNNCEIFSNDIICAIPYMTSLLVFTTNALYKLTFNDDGLTYVSECVQERLNMIPSDVNTVVTVQNMVYFKSGNYFYMVVPNSRLNSQTGVQLAPVSRMVEYMFDNIEETFLKILNEVYGIARLGSIYDMHLGLVDFNIQVANTQIRNIYKVRVVVKRNNVDSIVHFDISLNYDTVLRAWTVYVYQSSEYRDCIYKATVTGENILLHIHRRDIHYDDPPRWREGCIVAGLVQFNSQNPKDDIPFYKARYVWNDSKTIYGNWQFIDTGYRTFSEDLKKRFREVQFCVNILKDSVLKFNTSFVVDDVERVPMYKYFVSQIEDDTDPDYGVIFIDCELCDTIDTVEPTEFNSWEFDSAAFPGITVNKIRYKVSGKGYGGSVKILSKNEVPFELLHINWVYRVMFAR